MIEIKSSLLNHSDFKNVKNSIIKVSEKDGKDKFRVKLIEYINDSSDTSNDIFFYDMLEFVRFLDPSDDSIAYTTPDHLIYLNAPDGGKIGEKYRQWDFTYDHECLHQLWETFKVADKIKEKYGSYNHMLLNIASDCVINDYLYFYRKKDRPDNLITPEYLESGYGVKYDRKIDTQFTLYEKLKEAIENNKKLQDKMNKDPMMQQAGGDGQGDPNQSQSEGDSSSDQQGGGNSSSDSSNSNNDSSQNQSGEGNKSNSQSGDNQDKSNSPQNQAENSAKEAQSAADKAKSAAGDDKDKQDAADRAQKAADKAKEEADKAKEAAENGDEEGAKEHADAAKKAEQEAKDAAKEAGVEEKDLKDNNKPSDNKKGGNEGSNNLTETPEDLAKIKKKAEELIEKYRNRISGEFGKFISKCKSSHELKESGLAISSKNSTQVPGWNQQMNSAINAFVKNRIFKKKREIELTYKRMPRRSGFVKVGDPLKKGKRIKKQLLTINVAFYIDRSGSMGGEPINNVFKAAYTICESLKKQFSHEKVVDDITFKMHAFDYNIHEIKFGSKMSADGGTLEFHKLVKYIKDNTNDYLINIIITDAGFSDINADEIEKFINDIDGLMLFITNTDNDKMIDISKKHDTKLTYILADQSFTIK